MSKRKSHTIEDLCYFWGILLFLCIIAILAVMHSKHLTPTQIGLPCLFYRITGYYCPGCGGTRAVEALLSGDLVKSFFYHPAVPYAAALYFLFMASHTLARLSKGQFPIQMKFRPWYLWTTLILILLQCIVKNVLL